MWSTTNRAKTTTMASSKTMERRTRPSWRWGAAAVAGVLGVGLRDVRCVCVCVGVCVCMLKEARRDNTRGMNTIPLRK